MSTVQKGTYHRKRTQEWLESLGYTVTPLEFKRRVYLPPKAGQGERVLYQTYDVWGSDLCARNEDHLIFIQVKANAGDIAKGVRELSQGPWPRSVGRWVCHWPARRRLKDGPEIEVVA